MTSTSNSFSSVTLLNPRERVLQYAVRRWMSVIIGDLPDYEFTQSQSGRCGDQQFDISAGERIDDLRIYVGSFDNSVSGPLAGVFGYGGPRLLRESDLPIFGCMAFDLKAHLLFTGLHEVGHVLGFGNRHWARFGFYQDPEGDPHFNGPLAIAAFDDAGGRDYAGNKVPVEGSHWRYPMFRGELMKPGGGPALSAITVQSLADLGYGVDVTQADPYTLPGTAAAQASAIQPVVIPAIPGNDRPSGRLNLSHASGTGAVVRLRWTAGADSRCRPAGAHRPHHRQLIARDGIDQ